MTESYFVIKKNKICRKIGTIGNHHIKKTSQTQKDMSYKWALDLNVLIYTYICTYTYIKIQMCVCVCLGHESRNKTMKGEEDTGSLKPEGWIIYRG